ncbi:heparan-alpha-glucosaminide N-acetyltransferase domain-containing protein [Microbacterium telephonicum]|uniref:Uncharacterized protein DUF1624 n=1 Tax=Microbacterium telephonicum TaxID=1714841 RepID=A0A498BXR4_9MICO|nr:heparan-alpha-glucosaminide N-acetyltransferase domain-containing protein [Microbacterium telephonicum]RLK48082.1 uncharacterized protein DUF1624 [Microbacterium telephonicum]
MAALRPAIAPRRQPQRLLIPDVLRGVAIFAMLVAHGIPLMTDVPWAVSVVSEMLNDVASPLFALVMGMSAQIVLQRPGASRGVVTAQQLARGVILIALGVWLTSWGSWVAIVLAFLGLTLLVGAPLLLLSGRVVAVVLVLVVAVSEPLILELNRMLVPLVAQYPVLMHPAGWISLDPYYRLINLLPMFLAGALLLRAGIPASWRALSVTALIGLVAFSAERAALVFQGYPPVSGTWADTAGDVGLVAFAYAGVGALAGIRAPAVRRVVDVVFVPFRACGSVALSLYVLQIALIASWSSQGLGWHGNEPLPWLVLVPGLMTVGTLWWRFVGIGPIEWLMGLVTGRYAWPRVRATRN